MNIFNLYTRIKHWLPLRTPSFGSAFSIPFTLTTLLSAVSLSTYAQQTHYAVLNTNVTHSFSETLPPKPSLQPAAVVKNSPKKEAEATVAFAENFDQGFDGWTFTHGEGNVIVWELKKNSKTSPYEDDVQSLHADGPYQVYKRTVGTALSPKFMVPTDGKLHAKVYLAPVFTDYAVITFSIVEGSNETAVWSSANITEGSSQWFNVEADLSAFASKEVSLKITYGSGINDTFHVGGYMADFYIDDIKVDTQNAEDQEEEEVLTAAMDCPATFRDLTTRRCMVAPLLPVQFHDRSTGNPTEWTWLLTNGNESQPTSDILVPTDEYYHEQNPYISYNYLGKQYAVLAVSNEKDGSTYCFDSLEVKYEGLISNLRNNDMPTVFDMGDDGVFPGSNKSVANSIAERFSRPSRPSLITGAYVYCTKAEADELYEQIQSVTFSICRDNNGEPGEEIDSDSWTVTELGYAVATNDGIVTVEFNKPLVIDEDFWFVISGIPTKTDHIDLRFAMATMRSEGNTTYMLHNGKWRPMNGYFQTAPAGQTSLYVMPMLRHSVLTFLPTDVTSITVCKEASQTKQQIYSWLGYKYVGCNESWCRVSSTPNGYTLDEITVDCDEMPDGVKTREAELTFTDGVSTLKLKVVQDATVTGINTATTTETADRIYNINGQQLKNVPVSNGIVISNGRKYLNR